MMKQLLLGAALAVTLALPATGQSFANLSDQDRAALHDEIRDYLLANPGIMLEMVTLLEEQRAAEAEGMELALIEENAAALYSDDTSYVGGNPEGDITIVEFTDYQCSFCKRAHPEVTELLASDGNIRLIRKEFPILGPASEQAARAALAVLENDGPEVYDRFSSALMGHDGPLNATVIRKLAADVGADADAMEAAADSDEITMIVGRNRALGAALQITGTPTFVLGDQMLRGYVPLEDMRMIVEDIRDRS